VYRFPDPPVHPFAFSVDHFGAVPIYDMVERDGLYWRNKQSFWGTATGTPTGSYTV